MTDHQTDLHLAERLGLDEDESHSWNHYVESSWLLYETLNRKLIDEHHLTLFDVQLLELLARSDTGSVRMGAVAENLTLPPSRVTAQVSRLELGGLVGRRAGTQDRRGVFVNLTQEGYQRLELAMRTYAKVVRTLYLDRLTRRQMLALGESTRRISSGLRTNSPAEKD